MPRFPTTEQRTVAGAPRIQGSGAEGAGMAQVGQAIKGVGEQLAAIEANNRNRADVIDRVRLQNQFDQAAIDLRQETLTGMDISSPDAVNSYRQGLKQTMDSMMAEHSGSPSSKANLRASLMSAEGQYIKQIMSDQIQAQQVLLMDSVSSLSNQLSSAATVAPDTLDDSIMELDQRIAELSPALTAEQEQEYKRIGRENIITGAATGYLERGDFESADKILNNEAYSKILSPSTSRRLRISSAKTKGEHMEKEQAYDNRVAQYTLLTERNLSPMEKAKIKLLPDKPSDMTPADKIAEYEIVTGAPASQAVVDKIYKVTDKGRFGTSLRGRSLETVNDNVSAYAAGTLSRQEAIEYQSAVTEAYGVKTHTDPVTGQQTQSQPSMPPAIRQALDAGATFYGPMDLGGPASDGVPGGARDPDAFEGTSLWSMADEVSGPITAAQRAGFEMTGIGDPIQQRAASAANWMREHVVAGIRPEGRIANQYRQELMELVDIQPKVLRNDMAYRYKLADVDTKLRDRLTELRSITDGEKGDYTIQERRDAMTLSHNIEGALARLNVKRPKTVEEAKALPAGSYFVDPAGMIRQVPVVGGDQ